MKKLTKTLAAIMLMATVLFTEGCTPEGYDLHASGHYPNYRCLRW